MKLVVLLILLSASAAQADPLKYDNCIGMLDSVLQDRNVVLKRLNDIRFANIDSINRDDPADPSLIAATANVDATMEFSEAYRKYITALAAFCETRPK